MFSLPIFHSNLHNQAKIIWKDPNYSLSSSLLNHTKGSLAGTTAVYVFQPLIHMGNAAFKVIQTVGFKIAAVGSNSETQGRQLNERSIYSLKSVGNSILRSVISMANITAGFQREVGKELLEIPPYKEGTSSRFSSGKRWSSPKVLSNQASAVLRAAFDTEDNPLASTTNAYDFAKYNGHRVMDWWNFPWDLPSSQSQYTLTYQDMEDLLHIKVLKEKDGSEYVRYSEKLKEMVLLLTPEIMNNCGGVLRVTKIIYCVRNFLEVAIKSGDVSDQISLASAAKHLLGLLETKKLCMKGSPYTAFSTYAPRTITGQLETRNPLFGKAELKRLINKKDV